MTMGGVYLAQLAQWSRVGQYDIVFGFRPVGAVVARSLDMGKVIGSNPILGTF